MAYSYIVNQSRGGTVGKPGPPVQANVNGQLVLIYEVLETEPDLTTEFVLECLPPVGRCTLYESQLTGPNAPLGAYLPVFGTAAGFAPDTLDAIPVDVQTFGNPSLHLRAPFAYTSPSGRLYVRSQASAAEPVPLEIRHRFVIVEGHEGPSTAASNSNEAPIELRFSHPEFGQDMNRDGRTSGASLLIYDGDGPSWTTTNEVGAGVDFASGVRPFPPSLVGAEVFATTGDIWQFENPGGGSFDLTPWMALAIEVNVDKDWTATDTIIFYGWDGSVVGTPVSLSDFFEETITDTWFNLVIPLASMGLSGASITAFRMEVTARNGARPLWYFDELYLWESGGPLEFRAEALPGTVAHVESLIIMMANSSLALSTADGASHGFDRTKLVGLNELANGVVFQQFVSGNPTPVQTTVRSLADALEADFDIVTAASVGTETYLKLRVRFPRPLIVAGAPGNYLVVLIADDLRGLSRLRVRAVAGFVF